MLDELKVGDKVMVYALGLKDGQEVAYVVQHELTRTYEVAVEFKNGDVHFAHKKQVRKLNKKRES